MGTDFRIKFKKVLMIVFSCVLLLGSGIFGIQAHAEEDISLDDVRIRNFKIIDVANGNKEIDYRVSDDAQYDEYLNDATKFSNALCENQTNSKYKLNLEISYSSQNPLKEGDKLTIPGSIGANVLDFASKPLMDGTNHQLGTWEYKNGKFVITFSGEYINNNRVTQFTASFETGETAVSLNDKDKTTNLGERKVQIGLLGKEKLVVAREKQYVLTQTLNESNPFLYKTVPAANDTNVTWQFSLMSDYVFKKIGEKPYSFYNPYLLENNGAYSPQALTDIYVEDTLKDVTEAPFLVSLNVWLSGLDDNGKVISGDYILRLPLSILQKVEQGDKTKAEIKDSLNKGEYCIYDNHDGSYTFMLKWWDMNDSNGMKYDDIPEIQRAGGVGNYLKELEPGVFGNLQPETIQKTNDIFRNKAIQNVFIHLRSKYVPVKERTEVPNTAKISTAQLGDVERTATGILTPSAGIADAPADPLSVKLLKSDAKTGQNLSDGFKFELQTTNDNGTTWERVAVTQEMLVEGTLNGDATLSPNANGTIEVKRLTGGKKYRFLEKAHPEEYENVHEDSNNPNTIKNPKSSNSRVVEISNQGTGKVVVMYNQPKPEKVEIKVVKNWVGPEKEQVTVKLLADGQDTGKTLELNRQQNWMGSFTNLDSVKADGTEINYSIEEVTIAGYQSVITGDAKTGFTITNTNVEKISVEGTKTWDDNNNQDGKRPTQITINLLKNGVKVSSKNVTAADGWKWKFENLDKYENGNENTYTVTEERVDGYSTEVNGYNVKNTYTPGKTSVQVTKAWDDNNDKDNKRPISVTIKLLADGRETGNTLVLTKENRWTGSFTGLDEYKDGKKIVYTIKEELLGNDYKSVITGNEQDGFVVTNVRATDTTNKTPKTGDRSNLALYVGLLALSATILLVLARKKGSIKKHVK